MSETPSNTPENAYETPPSLAGSRRTANRPRRALIGLGIGAAVIGVIQWFAGDTDFQFAFMGCFVVGLFTSVYVLWQLQWLSASQGKGWLVPSVTVAAIALFAVAFEFRGFNGEMVPQFHWRFGEPKPELVTTVTPEETAELDADSEEGQQDPSGEEQAETLVTQTLSDWPQFLGRHRNGIIDQRRFAIPTSVSDVEIVWDHGIGDGWSSFAVQEPYAITLEQRDEAECVTAYRIKDGTMAWIRQHEASHFQAMGGGGPRTTPLIDGDRVYAQGSTGVVWCLDLGSGDVIWSVDLLEKAGWSQSESEVAIAWGRSGSPLLVDDMCVVPFGGPESAAKTGRSLIALNADSGEVLWTAGEDQISYASPQLLTFDGSRQIVIVNESTITGHALTDGAVQWSIQWPGSSNGQANCAAVVPAGPNRFVVGKGYGGGSALITVE
ncbi:MAG: PQQ-binding-like beta-propeller repeat protein, partial [Planctomycetota bacterium]